MVEPGAGAALVEAEADEECVAKLTAMFPGKTLELALRRMASTIEVEKILRQIESAAGRTLLELVKAIKEYTYMDQAGEKEIDLHDGLESTLTMLHHDLKKGINVRRDYDRTLPQICARGSDLNQVWTNLIDNAIDALADQANAGKGEITVHTARDDGYALVDIMDNGPGIPPEIKGRIFDPFFTTKPVGEGTGLGLDTVYRIVRQHKGKYPCRFASRGDALSGAAAYSEWSQVMKTCTHLDQIKDVKPHTRGCEECLKMGDSWVHLRLCLSCGHVGCCDSSKNKHATKHFHATKHPIMRSLEPGEDWAWCFVDEVVMES